MNSVSQAAAGPHQHDIETIYCLTAIGRIGQLIMEPFIAANPGHIDASRLLVIHPANIRPGNVAAYRILQRYYDIAPRTDFFNLAAAATIGLGENQVEKWQWNAEQDRWVSRFAQKVHSEGEKPVFFSLTDEEESYGRAVQTNLGIPLKDPVVCLHIRESGYVKLSHHDHRNADPMTFVPAVDYLLQEGYWVVRLGDPSMTPLPSRPKLIELPFITNLNDFADIWFATHCDFMLGNTSGPHLIPLVFNGPPRLMVNWIDGAPISFNPRDRYIPKTVQVCHDGKRTLSFGERMFIGNSMNRADLYHDAGLNVIDNTPQDILSAAGEMVSDIRAGKSVDPDHPLQVRYREIAAHWHRKKRIKGECEPYYLGAPPVSTAFLERNRQMLSE